MVALILKVNRFLEAPDEGTRDVVLGASDLAELVERAGLLVEMDERAVEESRALLGGLPVGVHDALLAALQSAVGRGVPVVIQWRPGSAAEVALWEELEDDVGQMGVLLTTPYGRTFKQST